METQKGCLGVIGGLGPMATAYFMELVCQMTDAKTDQEHLEMIIRSSPHIPDRTRYILDKMAPNPIPELISVGQWLAGQGASQIAIPCFTAHCFYDELVRGIDVPIINGPAEVAAYLKASGVTCAGIMATDGTVSQRLFHTALEQQGITPAAPSESRQADVMSLIYDCIKQGIPAEMGLFSSVAEELHRQGAEVIILGCTELSMIKRDQAPGHGFLDAMEVLARSAVVRCGGKLNPKYRELIS